MTMNKSIRGIVQERNYAINPMERSLNEGGLPVFRGRAVAFNEWSNLLYDDFKEIIYDGATDGALMDRAIAVFNHDEDQLLGTYEAGTLRVRTDKMGVFVEIDEAETTVSKNCAEWVKRGEIRGMSFKFFVAENGSEWRYNDEKGWWEHHITKIEEILDFSLVTRAAYPTTTAKHEQARSMGFDPEEMRNSQRATPKDKPLDRELALLQKKGELYASMMEGLN